MVEPQPAPGTSEAMPNRLDELCAQLERKLADQNEFLNSVLESLAHPFYVINAGNHTIELANSAARMAGVSEQATCYAFTHGRSTPCDTADHPCPLEEIRRTKRPTAVDHIHRDADGAETHVEVRGYPLFDAEGNVDRIIEYELDVTDRRQAEAALLQSETKLHALFQILPIGISILDQDRQVAGENPALERILGLSSSALQEGRHQARTYLRSDGTVMPPQEFPSTRAFNEQRLVQDQVGVVKEDGKLIWTEVSAAPVPFADWKVVLVTTDITARKQAEEALRKSEALLRQTQAIAGIGGWELDIATQEVQWTEEVYRIHEVPPTFRPVLETGLGFYEEQDRKVLRQAVERAIETGAPWDLELRLLTATGRQLWVRAVGQAEFRDGRVARLWGTFRDVTERRRVEEAQRETAVAAERSRLARDLHDSVTQALFSASLVAEVLPQVWRRDPDEGMKAADDLRRLVRGALAEMRAMLVELRPTALLATSLDDLVRQLAEAITGRTLLSVSLNLEPVPPLPPDVHLTFYRVCQEALQNAVKHADASHVTVSLRTSALGSPNGNGPRGELALERSEGRSESTWRGQVLLQVSDDGQGFDPQNTRPDQLGLRIMRERAESIGARLSLECRPGVGTQVALAWQSA